MTLTTPPSAAVLAPIRIWIATLLGAIFIMILLGGATRLTDSGLSMAEWRPLFGWLPPLEEDEWARVFCPVSARERISIPE